MGKHILIWLASFLAVFLVVPFLASTHTVWSAIAKETEMIETYFGKSDAEQVLQRAGAVHRALIVESGIGRSLALAKSSQSEQAKALPGTGKFLTTTTNSYLDTLGAMIFGIAMRLVILLGWLPFIFPFLLAAIGEGYARRKIKFATFGQYGVMVYAGAAHLSIVLMMAPLLYLLLPFPVLPLFVPFWALVAALPLALMVANASQVLPK